MASTGKPRRSFRWSVVVVPLGVLAVVAVAALLVIRPFGRTNGGSDYLTEAVALGDLEKSISSSGKLEAGLTTAVNPKVPGEVSSVSVRMGERVKRGDPLFTISKDDLSAAYNMANQKLKAAKAQVNAAKSSLKVAQATVVQSVDEVLASGSGGTNNTSGSGGVGDTD
ncbi:MAG: biotin/lipoyl-binding protein, partial [Coriobacteriia bacterium]|nr:biotin/lipoyl-binding protein [Coriobacteriia bacterium]